MIPLDIEAAQKGSLRQLADDVFWARFDLPFRLNHINLYILATAEGWVLIAVSYTHLTLPTNLCV